MHRYPHIFKPLKIKDVVIPNRIVFPPTVTGYCNPNGSVSERQMRFYKTIAQAGVGLVIIGATAVSEGGNLFMGCARIDTDAYIDGFRDLFALIKMEGCYALAFNAFHMPGFVS